MAVNVAELRAVFTVDTSGFSRGMNAARHETKATAAALQKTAPSVGLLQQRFGQSSKKIEEFAQGLGLSSQTLKFGVAGAAAVGGAAVVKFGRDTARAASDLTEQLSATQVTFGSATRSVVKFAEAADKNLGLSQTAALQASNTFGAFFGNIGLGEKQSASLSTALVQLSGDIASFRNAAGGANQVAQDLRSGLSGEAEPLRKYGIFLDEAKTKNKALALGLGASNRELSDGEKILSRYALVMEQSSKAHGDFARTSSSLANQQRVLTAETENFKASLGELSTPVILGVTEGLVGLLSLGKDLSKQSWAAEFFKGLPGVVNPVLGLGQTIHKMRGETDQAKSATEKFQEALAAYQNVAANSKSSNSAMAAALRDVKAAAADAVKEQDRLRDATKSEAQIAQEAAARQKDLRSALVGNVDAARALESAKRGLSGAQMTVVDTQRQLNDLLKRGAVDAKAVANAQKEVTAAERGVAAAAERVLEVRRKIAGLEAGPSALDKEQASITLARARDAVGDAEQRLAELRSGSTVDAAEVARAELRVAQATAKLSAVRASATAGPLELRDAELDLAEARATLLAATTPAVVSAEDLEDAELSLRQAKVDLTRVEQEQAVSTDALTEARKELAGAEQEVADAQGRVADAQAALATAQAGDPDFTKNVTDLRWKLAAATDGVRDAQWRVANAALAARDAAAAQAQAFKDDADQVGRLRSELGALAATYPGLQALLSAFGGQIGGGGTLSVPAVNAGSVPRPRAAGGPVMAGHPYNVVELGRPEVFVPDTSGMIYPVGQGGGGRGGTTNIYVTAGVGDPVAIGEAVERVLARSGRRGFGN